MLRQTLLEPSNEGGAFRLQPAMGPVGFSDAVTLGQISWADKEVCGHLGAGLRPGRNVRVYLGLVGDDELLGRGALRSASQPPPCLARGDVSGEGGNGRHH